MGEKLKELRAAVGACTDPRAAAEALVRGVADQLDNLTHDPVAIKVMADELRASASDLGAAVLENTKPEEPAKEERHTHSRAHKK